MNRKRIGELLLERGAITADQLEAGLLAQKRTRARLGATLVQMGVLSEVKLAQALAASLSLKTVDLTQAAVDWSAVHLVRAQFCEKHELFPFAVDGKGTPTRRVMVAMSDPLNQGAIEELELTTGLPVAPYVSTLSQVRAAILRYYHKQTGPSPAPARQDGTEPDDEPPTVVGEDLPAAGPADGLFDELLGAVANAPPRSPDPRPGAELGKALGFLYGEDEPALDRVEQLERRVLGLLRTLVDKGLLTRDEAARALAGDDDDAPPGRR